MTTVFDIDAYMSEWAPKELSEVWDNDGIMLCENIGKKSEKVLVCLEINAKTVKQAKDLGCDLIITHHPYIFRPMKNICKNEYRTISLLMENGISVLSYHTRLDAAQNGVNDTLAKVIGLVNVQNFAGMGRVGELERAIDEKSFCAYIKEKLSCPVLRTSASCGRSIKKVAVLGGAGKDFVADAAKIADAYITGDLSHNAFIDAADNDVFAVDAGHYSTENPIVFAIAEKLGEKFSDIKIYTADSGCPFEIA